MKWAGTYRLTGRNIGIEAYRIPEELVAMLGDVRYWGEHKTFPPDEIAIRLHHRLVAIHPFPNGNGRHARLIADLLIERLGSQPFSWGGGKLADAGELRAKYIAALQAADNHNVEPLLAFARLSLHGYPNTLVRYAYLQKPAPLTPCRLFSSGPQKLPDLFGTA